jgi:hypothetical protein
MGASHATQDAGTPRQSDVARREPPAPFIVGTGRCGSTLLRLMLDANSRLAIPPETNFVAAGRAFALGGAMSAAEALVEGPPWGDFNLSADEFVDRVREQRPDSFGGVLRIFYKLYAESRGKSRWGDKTPLYTLGIALIHEQLPEARFVHLIRDGRDVALSMMPLPFGPDTVTDMAHHWRRTLEKTRSRGRRLPYYTEVRYEDLVRDPAGILRRLCDFLDLDWEPAMLDYHQDASRRMSSELGDLVLPKLTLSRSTRLDIHRRLDRPPQTDRVERWREEMSPADRRAFEGIAGETLEELGYEVG